MTELVRYRVILQIGVGQDDKFDKEKFFFKDSKGFNYRFFTKGMARKAQTGQRWSFHRLLGL